MNLQRGDRVTYRGSLGTVRCVADWLRPANADVRLDDGRLIFDLETCFEKIEKENRKVTVQELIAQLTAFDGELPVVMASDSEGNCISPLADISHEPLEAESKWDLYYDPDGDDHVILWPLR